jgi:hypothetical protein
LHQIRTAEFCVNAKLASQPNRKPELCAVRFRRLRNRPLHSSKTGGRITYSTGNLILVVPPSGTPMNSAFDQATPSAHPFCFNLSILKNLTTSVANLKKCSLFLKIKNLCLKINLKMNLKIQLPSAWKSPENQNPVGKWLG